MSKQRKCRRILSCGKKHALDSGKFCKNLQLHIDIVEFPFKLVSDIKCHPSCMINNLFKVHSGFVVMTCNSSAIYTF